MSRKKTITPNGKHLTEDDRAFIAEALQINMTFKQIAKQLCKDATTISKEIRTNRVYKQANCFMENGANLCVYRKTCMQSYICAPELRGKHCISGCSKCMYCTDACKVFEKEECPNLKKAPYVCNGCKRKSACRLKKYYYRAVTAQRKYDQRLRVSRMGLNISAQECMDLDNFITPLVKKGQPLSHIYNSCTDKIPCSKTTLYRYVNSGALSIKNIDLRSVVRYKPRKKKYISKPTYSREGRTYLDFTGFTSDNPQLHIWEMDVVEGRKGGKALLTLFSRETKLMLIFLLEQNTQDEVLATINFLEEQIGPSLFFKTFQIILTDNGSSFLNPNELEFSFLSNKRRTWIFYCDPYSPYQKGAIEKNHEYIRWILPKGSSFDDLSWHDVALLASHINSIARDSLDGLTPFAAMKGCDPSLLDRVYLTPIHPNEVTLTPDLLK
ncbi:MAG: IS30 family transposase [Clostridiales bacterium]|nr:IS30 family transposase [Clostridiales bacterium]